MQISSVPVAIADALVTSVEDGPRGWVIAASGSGHGACPTCGTVSSARHSGYLRRLQDLPVQGAAVTIHLSVARLRCRNNACGWRTFVEPLPALARPLARRTCRLADTLHRVGHSMGGRPVERLLAQLGMIVSDDTVLRLVKRRAARQTPAPAPRVLGIDDWAWAKGQRFGTILVDLERRTVVDVLPDRSSASTAAWLAEHPGVEIISRDRHGLYAEGARIGAPDARQVADRFHLVQTLREKIEQALGRLGRPVRQGTAAAAEADERRALRRQELADSFAEVRALYEAGRTATDIVRDLGLSRRRVDKWVKLTVLPDRNAMAPKPNSPAFFDAYLARRWAEGCTVARRL